MLTTIEQLEAIYGQPHERAVKKEIPYVNEDYRAFIDVAPFVVHATAGPDGLDCSPRGDAPGFVAVLDERTLVIPDRPGNRRVDTMLNVAENPHLGLLFMVPGINETLRVNGTARFTKDAALLAPLAVNGKAPVASLVVAVDEVYFHCGKALIRSRLWDPESRVERRHFPTLGRILADQIAGMDAGHAEEVIDESYRSRLY